MNDLALRGRNWTIRIFASVILMSIHTIVTYNLLVDDVPPKKLVQQVVRFVLTLALLYYVYKGKEWAVVTLTILFAIGLAMCLYTLAGELPLPGKIPLAVMAVIYSVALYHLNFSESYREYKRHLNTVL